MRRRFQSDHLAPALLMALGMAAGVFPFLLFAGYPRQTITCAAVMAGFGLLMVRRTSPDRTEKITFSESILFGGSALYLGSIPTLFAFLVHGVAYSLGWLGNHAIGAFGGHYRLEVVGIARLASLFALLLLLLGATPMLGRQLRSLFPETAGLRSAFFNLAARPRWVALLALAYPAALTCALWYLDTRNFWHMLALSWVQMSAVSPLYLRSLRSRSSPAGQAPEDERAAVASLLQAAGYHVTPNPRTGKAEIDPLVQSLDFLAVSSQRAFAITLPVRAKPSGTVDWSAAATLRTAARALQSLLEHDGRAAPTVDPFLLVVGGQLDDALAAFCRDEEVKVVCIVRSELMSSAEGTGETVRKQALRLLQIPPGEPPAASSAAAPKD